MPTNMSDDDVEIVGAEILDVPGGVEIDRYGAYSLDDTDGIPLLVKEGDPHSPRFRELRDHSPRGFTVQAKTVSEVVYMAQLRITGPVRRDATSCRYDYRQGDWRFSQTLRCSFALRLKA
ncbi:hypothetical protein ACF068_00965 [Streptomyces sp. NPDC016309]|uniref:hypothetical protein n=1 Tax=Streptomyces sp. NPDC016309 TaxID=3364965 RepID=UPI0036F65442